MKQDEKDRDGRAALAGATVAGTDAEAARDAAASPPMAKHAEEAQVEGEEEQSASLERRRYGTRHWALLRVGSVGSERPARVRVFKVDISHNW